MKTNLKFVVIGGGTGTFSVLTGLKKYCQNITAIVNMSDSGGSARKERDEWGLLPSSDIRKSLIALSDVSDEDSLILRKLFQYRYSQGKGITGMTFGNLFLVALTKLLGSQDLAIKKAGNLLKIKGQVLPVTLDKIDLVANYEDGTEIIGEHFIDQPKHNGKIKLISLYSKPKASANPEAIKAIKEAEVIIIGPGGFYTTIIANLIIKNVRQVIEKSKAVKIYILNLMTEYGQTFNFTAATFLAELDKYLKVNSLDFVLINNQPIPDRIIKHYKRYKATPVINDLIHKYPFKIIESDLLVKKMIFKQKGDSLRRSLVRHSGEKSARLCLKVLGLL